MSEAWTHYDPIVPHLPDQMQTALLAGEVHQQSDSSRMLTQAYSETLPVQLVRIIRCMLGSEFAAPADDSVEFVQY